MSASAALYEIPDIHSIESPFPIESVPRVFLWSMEFWRSVMDDSMPQEMTAFVDRWEKTERLTWGVYRGEDIGGAITARIEGDVAHLRAVFARRFWEEETTKPAIDIVVKTLFEQGIAKVAWWPPAHASALVSLARAAGFTREGTLHKQVTQRGKRIDLALFGIWKEGI